jgi:hypothetical protein
MASMVAASAETVDETAETDETDETAAEIDALSKKYNIKFFYISKEKFDEICINIKVSNGDCIPCSLHFLREMPDYKNASEEAIKSFASGVSSKVTEMKYVGQHLRQKNGRSRKFQIENKDDFLIKFKNIKNHTKYYIAGWIAINLKGIAHGHALNFIIFPKNKQCKNKYIIYDPSTDTKYTITEFEDILNQVGTTLISSAIYSQGSEGSQDGEGKGGTKNKKQKTKNKKQKTKNIKHKTIKQKTKNKKQKTKNIKQ